MKTLTVPTIYELSPFGVEGVWEANGIVHHFCSEKCCTEYSEAYLLSSEEKWAYGHDSLLDTDEDEICSQCGFLLKELCYNAKHQH